MNKQERDDRILQRRAEGLTLQAIGDELGVSKETVRGVLKRKGYEPAAEIKRRNLLAAMGEAVDLSKSLASIAANKRYVSEKALSQALYEEFPWIMEQRKLPIWERTGLSWCADCQKDRPVNEFYFLRSKNRPAGRCKQCSHQNYITRRDVIDLGPTPPTKECRACKQTKASELFYASKINNGGLSSYCKQCNNERVKEYRRNK